MPCSIQVVPHGWRSHEEIIAWQLASQLKNRVYELIDADPRIKRDVRFHDHLDGAVSSTPRLIAEGFGRYLPGDFSGYLRRANGELKETLECLADGVDRRVSEISCVGHSMRSLYAPQTKTGEAERRDPGADPR